MVRELTTTQNNIFNSQIVLCYVSAMFNFDTDIKTSICGFKSIT